MSRCACVASRRRRPSCELAAQQLGLGDPQLHVADVLAGGQRDVEGLQLVAQIRAEMGDELLHGPGAQLADPLAGPVVEGCLADLVEHLADHRADPEQRPGVDGLRLRLRLRFRAGRRRCGGLRPGGRGR
ncbi:MAG TPA: hypothetical protein VK935_03300 [Actinomycetospora sp.]|nr:hypothetical protein [Actinomycetospora sp.]